MDVSLSRMDNDILKFHRAGKLHRMVPSTERHDGCMPLSHRPVLFCATALTVPTRRLEARHLWGGILLAELSFQDQRHVSCVAFQDDCKLVQFCS